MQADECSECKLKSEVINNNIILIIYNACLLGFLYI